MGKASIIYVMGLGFIVGYALLNINTAGTDAITNYVNYYNRTVSRNIAFGLRHRIPDAAKRDAVVRSWIAKVKLDGFEKAYPKQLSGGMQQRVAIARALAPEPQVLLMDEPFGALDAQTRVLMQEMLEGLIAESRNAVIFVTHDIDEALIVGDTLCVMSRRPGRVLETAKRTQVVSYAVSAQGTRNRFLRDLVTLTGGSYLEIQSTSDLGTAFAGILEEFRHRYLLSYRPEGVTAGGWHQIEVRVRRPGVTVRARAGYLSSQ